VWLLLLLPGLLNVGMAKGLGNLGVAAVAPSGLLNVGMELKALVTWVWLLLLFLGC
jgi:hypothetical protein